MAGAKKSWTKILKQPYTRSACEENSFRQVYLRDKKMNNDVIIKRVYDLIKSDPNTQTNLKKLYYEAIYGSNKAVQKRIRDRISYFKRDYK